jgi:F-type H+-transporting ATPase subunit gamma
MSSVKYIKQRINSVKNTAQIAKAMEMVSAAKMRKAQEFAMRARPYAVASLEMLKNLLLRTPSLPSLLQFRTIKNSALLVVTSDKGLVGAFNSNVIKKADAWIYDKKQSGSPYILITVGKKARDYFMRRNHPIQESFVGFGDYSTPEQTLPVAEELIRGFLYGVWDEAYIAYTNFRTTLRQEATLKRILPVTSEGIEEMVNGILPERGKYAESRIKNQESRTKYTYEYRFEPSPTEILESLVPQLIRMHVHHIILESNASEHSARMVAMKNASENAAEVIEELTLEYNKSRQAGITRELTEITAGKEALES